MSSRRRVLWIEDGAHYELAHLAAPVYFDGRFELFVATNASEADRLLEDQYDAIVLDIRLPPGESEEWISLYQQQSRQTDSVRLGLVILERLMRPLEQTLKDEIPKPRIGVLTVEEFDEFGGYDNTFNVRVWIQKHADMSETILLDMLEELFET